MSELLPANLESIPAAVEVLRSGGLVVFPTDTVYGLACLNQKDPLSRIYQIKGRVPDKLIARLISDADQIEIEHSQLRQLAEKHWPGPLTIVVGEVGYRVPDHDFTRALIRAVGEPLPTTSANRSGQSDALTATAAALALPDVELVLDGGTTPGQIPSTVIGADGDGLVFFREGALAKAELLASLDL